MGATHPFSDKQRSFVNAARGGHKSGGAEKTQRPIIVISVPT
jgi:hypothetical protein